MTQPMCVMDTDAARRITDQIKAGVAAVWELIAEAYTQRAWAALGYGCWDDYCTREFGTARLRLPREERAEVVSSLRDSGLSIRAIASATGHGYGTIHAATRISPDRNRSPDLEDEDAFTEKLIAGLDGKTYPSQPTKTGTNGDRAGATQISKRIQRISADLAGCCHTFTDYQVSEALGAAQFLYELLRGEKIIRERNQP